jgi:hypothetical protein
MSVPGDVSLRLTILIRGKSYRLTVTPENFSLVSREERRRVELPWSALADEEGEMMSAIYRAMRRPPGRRGR